jgi:hypothetical protein
VISDGSRFSPPFGRAPPKTARGAAAEALPNGPEVNRRNNIALKKKLTGSCTRKGITGKIKDAQPEPSNFSFFPYK